MPSCKTIIFYDASFPYQGERPDNAFLHSVPGSCRIADAKQLAPALEEGDSAVLLHLHGPYFPKDTWGAVLRFLKRGGGLVHIGGAPFRIPVYDEGGIWKEEAEQTAYHKEMNIQEALRVDSSRIASHTANPDLPLFAGSEGKFDIMPTYGLILHVTKTADLPHESGSGGPMDAHIYPLLKGISASGRETAAPAVLLEHTKGDFAGGRWVLINQPVTKRFWQNGGTELLGRLHAFCAEGVTEMWLKPNYASYKPGERPELTLQLQRLSRQSTAGGEWTFSLRLMKETEETPIWQSKLNAQAGRELSFLKLQAPIVADAGFYRLECRAEGPNGETRILRQGFWGFDEMLLQEGSALACDRDYFIKDGRPMPVVGMTYMTSDVARKFLFLPNAAVWDRDMAQMRRAGINLIRTGIWTAWRHLMFIDGHPSEELLRSIDAFVLTAKKHGLEVTFTFFAFTPETWEGVNPYLDPRSIEAQKRYVLAIVSRYREATNIHWDLINEPSMFDPKRIFAGPRSAQDGFERAAYSEWLKERHGGDIRLLQERWNMTPDRLSSFEAALPPERETINFGLTDMSLGKKGQHWLDYCLFTMEMHNRWASGLRETIRSAAPGQLVGVGQDEGLGAQRPSPFFYADSVDYTTVHTWWLNDQLVWDGIFAKSPHKPNLIQETGIMYLENADGKAKRSEEELLGMLERKYAYAFSTGGAGAVQWIWNTNFYMNNINEAHIGALRADGTEKPEADVSYDFGAFMAEIRDLFHERHPEDVVAVFPYSNDFSNRSMAVRATSALTRVFAYRMNVPFRALGEYQLEALRDQPAKLLVVPSPHNLSDGAWEKLMEHVHDEGAVLLVTGPVHLNEYWNDAARLVPGVGRTWGGNVVREESLTLNGRTYPVSFGGNGIAELLKGVCAETFNGDAVPITAVHGKGKVIWCPLPVELNESAETMEALYRYALETAEVEAELEWKEGGALPGIYGRKLRFAQGSLLVFVSEYASDTHVSVKDPQTQKHYSFPLPKERSVLFATDAEGNLLAVYRPHAVNIELS